MLKTKTPISITIAAHQDLILNRSPFQQRGLASIYLRLSAESGPLGSPSELHLIFMIAFK